jgi:hypothetical protein
MAVSLWMCDIDYRNRFREIGPVLGVILCNILIAIIMQKRLAHI